MSDNQSRSNYRFYSIGIVVEDKPEGTDYIKVSPMEELSIQDSGNIADNESSFKGNKGSTSSSDFTTQHTGKSFVRAKWNSMGNGNRTSAPDVVAGESVILMKYGNVDEYFWDEIGREPSLRRLENVLYSFSNLSGGKGSTDFDKDTSYWVQVNTKDKFVHIHTADNDGEACTWDIRIDTGEGSLRIEDGLGNLVDWNAVAGTLHSKFNGSITREAPEIIDKSDSHTIETTTYLNQASGSVTNDTPMVTNTGGLTNMGDADMQGNVSTPGMPSVDDHVHTSAPAGEKSSTPNN